MCFKFLRVCNSSATFKNEYVITDSQGNARISFEDNGSGSAVVRQENSYYAFGSIIPNSPVATPTAPNKNLYNGGSEWQNDYGELPDYYQTFFRNYDAAIGRFVGVDPMAESADSWTTYQYAYNNPGMLNDPMGDLVDQGIPRSHDPELYLRNWEGLIGSEEYRKYRDDLLGNNGPAAQRVALIANNIGFQTAEPTSYQMISRINSELQPYGAYLDNSLIGSAHLSDGFTISFNTIGEAYSFNGNGYNQTYHHIVNHSFFIYTGDSNQDFNRHDYELSKYGQIVFAMAGSGSFSVGGGVTVEHGTLLTDKGWTQDYTTIYLPTISSGWSVGIGFGPIIAKNDYKPTFSDFEGTAYNGFNVSYELFSLSYGSTPAYRAVMGGIGYGESIKGSGFGGAYNPMSFTRLEGYPLSPQINNTNYSGFYSSTQTYLGGR